LPSVTVGAPIFTPVPDDHFEIISPELMKGELAYTFAAAGEMEQDDTLCYLVIRDFSALTGDQHGVAPSLVTYPLHVND